MSRGCVHRRRAWGERLFPFAESTFLRTSDPPPWGSRVGSADRLRTQPAGSRAQPCAGPLRRCAARNPASPRGRANITVSWRRSASAAAGTAREDVAVAGVSEALLTTSSSISSSRARSETRPLRSKSALACATVSRKVTGPTVHADGSSRPETVRSQTRWERSGRGAAPIARRARDLGPARKELDGPKPRTHPNGLVHVDYVPPSVMLWSCGW